MAMNPGDVCPQCKDGLLERTTSGIACSNCSFELEVDEIVKQTQMAKVTTGDYVFKPKILKVTIDEPELGEEFLRGLILARQNNNSDYFSDLIDGVNAILEPWRAARLQQELAGRRR